MPPTAVRLQAYRRADAADRVPLTGLQAVRPHTRLGHPPWRSPWCRGVVEPGFPPRS
jgi:hypothetical protein